MESDSAFGQTPDFSQIYDFLSADHACSHDSDSNGGVFHNLDQKTLEEYLDGFKQYHEEVPFTHIQIDAGYFPACGDWLDDFYRFPQGLKHAAETILKAGYEPGIWIGPFMVGDTSRLFREHPDWMLKDRKGGYVHPWQWYNEPKPWGYADYDYYVLDTSHPDAMEYLRTVFTTLRQWGITLFKTDFMFWGLQNSANVIRHTPGKTSVEYYRDILKMIRESIGEDAKWLGCIAPFIPSLGFVDIMRVAGDVGAQWEEDGFGPSNMIQELVADQYFNNVYWQNDPDAVMLRDFHISLKPAQIEALALLAAMSGSTIYTSDPIHKIGKDRLDFLRFIRPRHLVNAEYPFWSEQNDEICILQRLKGRTLVFFFNPTNAKVVRPFDWKKTVGGDACWIREYHGGSAPVEAVPYVSVEPRSGKLFFVTAPPSITSP